MRRGLRASCYPGERSRYRAGTPSGSGCRVDARLQGIIFESNSAGKRCGGVLEKRINEFSNLALGNRKRPGRNPARGLEFFEVLEKSTVCGTRKGRFPAASGANGVGPCLELGRGGRGMEGLAAGDAVTVPFPFTDFSSQKVRPALILAVLDRGGVLLCQITSQPLTHKNAIPLY